MQSQRVFQVALLVSIFTHATVIFQHVDWNFLSPTGGIDKVEVRYIKEDKQEKTAIAKNPHIPKSEAFLKIPPRLQVEKVNLPAPQDKEKIFKKTYPGLNKNPVFTKPNLNKPDIIEIKKKISLIPDDSIKNKNTAYLSHSQVVREKIRRNLYYNYSGTETGEVYLAFVVSSDGTLQDIRVVEEKSTSIMHLQEIALKSIKDASPFPAFPKGLDYLQLSFNVIISFQIE